MSARSEFVLEAKGLSKTYQQGRWWQRKFSSRALENVSLALRPGATLALTGESGSGKTTLARCLVGLEHADAGTIIFEGTDLSTLAKPARIALQRQIQLIFQDSADALSPRMSAAEIVEEPLRIQAQLSPRERAAMVEAMMERVGISARWKRRRPDEFSGGQRQRLAIARALVVKPKVLVLDEVFVGLDLSIQGQIANLLLEFQRAQGLSYLCISHNSALVSQIADEIVVIDHGQIVERPSLRDFSLGTCPVALQKQARAAHSGA
jgi:peptide/nickel transport system ATP-binding protein